MKKVILTIMLIISSVFTLFADDAEDIKNVFIQCIKYEAEFQLDKIINCYTEDCKIVSVDGDTYTTEQYKQLLKISDGAHPYECIIYMAKMENKGKEISPSEKYQLKQLSQTQEFAMEYKKICKYFKKMAKKSASLELDTIKFLDIVVDGTTATVTYEEKSLDFDEDAFEKNLDSNKIVSATTVCKLRKINGRWKIYEEISKKK